MSYGTCVNFPSISWRGVKVDWIIEFVWGWRSYLKPDLLIIDDFGMKQLPKRSGEFLFEIVMRRHETRSTMMTTNRPIEDWGKLLGDAPTAGAILDRFLHHSEIITITGRSYRLRHRNENSKPAGNRPQVGRPPRSTNVEKDSKPAGRRPQVGRPTGSNAEQMDRQPVMTRTTFTGWF